MERMPISSDTTSGSMRRVTSYRIFFSVPRVSREYMTHTPATSALQRTSEEKSLRSEMGDVCTRMMTCLPEEKAIARMDFPFKTEQTYLLFIVICEE